VIRVVPEFYPRDGGLRRRNGAQQRGGGQASAALIGGTSGITAEAAERRRACVADSADARKPGSGTTRTSYPNTGDQAQMNEHNASACKIMNKNGGRG